MLFYYSYLIGMRSHNFEGMPVLAGMMGIALNVALHIMTICLILLGCGVGFLEYSKTMSLLLKGSWLCVYASFYFYYAHNSRYLQIVEHYNHKNSNFFKKYPIVVFIISHMISLTLFALSALFNRSGGIYLFS
jgi:hypothetical protein